MYQQNQVIRFRTNTALTLLKGEQQHRNEFSKNIEKFKIKVELQSSQLH